MVLQGRLAVAIIILIRSQKILQFQISEQQPIMMDVMNRKGKRGGPTE